jgi:NAD(P)H-hydrate epimerase
MGGEPVTGPTALTRDQCRAVDRHAIEQLGIPGVVLMENAGRNAAELIEKWAMQHTRRARRMSEPLRDPSGRGFIRIVCGKGNNGGDGFVIARQLFNRGWPVSVDLAADPASLTGDAATNHTAAARMGIPIRELNGPDALAEAATQWQQAAVMVDALLGTGFAGQVREPLAGIINMMNGIAGPASVDATGSRQLRPLMVAIDVPSGLDADTGLAGGPAIRADRTITFLAPKLGYQKKTARRYVGRLFVVDIGAPLGLILERLNSGT